MKKRRLEVGSGSTKRAIRIETWWSLPTEAASACGAEEAVGLVQDALQAAVSRRLVADVPVGAYLSGGVDSSLIVSLMSRLGGGGGVETFSAGFGDPRYDELPYAREVSDAIGTRHHEVIVEPSDFRDLWHRLTWNRDAPISEPADLAIFAWRVSREITSRCSSQERGATSRWVSEVSLGHPR